MSELTGSTSSNGQATPQTLPANSIAAIRSWLQAQRRVLQLGRVPSREDVRRAMRLICDDVRSRELPVERIIVLIKQQWYALSDGDSGSPRTRDALDDIIRTCIEEFYAPTSRAPSQPSEPGMSQSRA